MSAGGGSNSNEAETNIEPTVPATTTERAELAPERITGKTFDMAIESLPAEALGDNSPVIGNKIIQEYHQDAMSYLQSDQDNSLDFYGKYTYQRSGDEADIQIKLTSSNTIYNIHYQFSDVSSGTWQGTFNNGLSQLSGTFTTKAASNLNSNNFSETVYVKERNVHSEMTNITYQYNVYLPKGYSASNKNHPVIYVTDAQWAADQRYAHIVETKKEDIIVVRITQGPEGRRTTDFLWPDSSHYPDFLA